MEHAGPHVVPYRTYLGVWAALVVLTGLLTVAGRFFHEALSVPAMLVLTPLKAALVLWFFMHLKYEKPYIRGMVLVALATLTVFMCFLFFDTTVV